MNLSEINWDINAAGSWPFPVKAGIVLLIGVAVLGTGIYLDTISQMAELENIERKEKDLKKEFESKQNKAINLQDYKDQLEQIETELFEMIRQMPTQAEIANLLTDISQTALANGLEFKLFQPGSPISKDFYTEIPIKIQVQGKYDELGLFISGVASLPRIVTIHDVNIEPILAAPIRPTDKNKAPAPFSNDVMVMNATIKTYHEGQASASSQSADAKKKKFDAKGGKS